MLSSVNTRKIKPTPSALKWLAEKRARLSYDLEFSRRLLEELTVRTENLEQDLAAIDRSINLYDQNIDPTDIQPVNGWRGAYGKRGALRNAILEVLTSQSPEWLSTNTIEVAIHAKFHLQFETPKVRMDWYRGSFRGALKQLCAAGLIERMADPSDGPIRIAYWRIPIKVTRLADMALPAIEEAPSTRAQ